MSSAAKLAREFTREELFLQRYDQCLKWALQLTKPDRELAKDLVQEAFLQFWLSNGSLVSINNIDSYLYRVVKNTYLSHLRRSPGRFQLDIEFDDLKSNPTMVDPFDQFRAKDELLAICQRACVRKETSVAASLLILRFFHGYLPNEIAKLTRRTRNVVDGQLKLARCEAASPNRKTSATKQNSDPAPPPIQDTFFQSDLVELLRQQIFSTKSGPCLSTEDLKKIQTFNKPVPRNKVSHLVSCVRCLDEANEILGLPSLKERDVFDSAGRAKGTVRQAYRFAVIAQALWLITCGPFWDLIAPAIDAIF